MSFRRVLAARAASLLIALPGAALLPGVARGQPPPAAVVVRPTPILHPDPVYPESERGYPHEVTVVVDVTVELDGTVSEPEVHQSGGAAFDEAAIAAVRTWTFSPARKNGKPLRSRVHALLHFDPPAPPAPPPPTNPPPPAPPTPPATTPAATTAPPAATPAATEPKPEGALDVDVVGHKDRDSGSAAEYHIPIDKLAYVPVKNASGRLGLAPGILLSNEGGEGHAEQVFLRGFDTHEGSEIEFTVDGVPINDSGNPHGTGYADTHFIIPEVISSLRILESPFDPAQGNYAVAGSADFHLGLEQRGLTVKLTGGSFGTERMLAMWGPAGMSAGTFGAVELYHTSGFGVNRAADRATGIVQYEGRVGETGTYRITGTAYGTSFQSAGVVRQDDVQSGAVNFYGTEDARQGGASSRFSFAAAIDNKIGDTEVHVQLFAVHRTMRLLENFTGFLEDTQNPLNNLHSQRGDLSDINFDGTTLGARASAIYSGKLLGFKQSIELGLYARGDLTTGTQQRIEAGSSTSLVPYLTDQDLSSQLGDIALYANASLRFTRWLSLRGGVRADLFEFDVQNNCAVQGDPIDHPQPSATPDVSCASQNGDGTYREPSQRTTTGTTAVQPRGTLVVGPFGNLTLSLSAGEGARTIDPSYVSQGNLTPFVKVVAYEGGVSYARLFDNVSVTAKSVFFSTHVGQDSRLRSQRGHLRARVRRDADGLGRLRPGHRELLRSRGQPHLRQGHLRRDRAPHPVRAQPGVPVRQRPLPRSPAHGGGPHLRRRARRGGELPRPAAAPLRAVQRADVPRRRFCGDPVAPVRALADDEQRPRRDVPRGRLQLRVVLPPQRPPGLSQPGPGAHVRCRGPAADPRLALRDGGRLNMKNHVSSGLLLLLLAPLMTACVGTTGSGLVDFDAYASGPPDATGAAGSAHSYTFLSPYTGYTITLTTATLQIGAVYLDAAPCNGSSAILACVNEEASTVAQVNGGATGAYGIQTTGLLLDVLSPDPQPFPVQGSGIIQQAQSAEVWLATADANSTDGIDDVEQRSNHRHGGGDRREGRHVVPVHGDGHHRREPRHPGGESRAARVEPHLRAAHRPPHLPHPPAPAGAGHLAPRRGRPPGLVQQRQFLHARGPGPVPDPGQQQRRQRAQLLSRARIGRWCLFVHVSNALTRGTR